MAKKDKTTAKRGTEPVVDKHAVENPSNEKVEQLAAFEVSDSGKEMTTNHGIKINDDHNSLKAGDRGATLLEDFILREKITHFDHERIPERVVHARGAGAHGTFKLYKSLSKYTRAAFLNNTEEETPVFVRFSTVAGSRGSTDLARDVRGFAVKFYTKEGNFDLVGNNVPVFFIQDAMKFPDLIHAVKPEPDNEIPQAQSAHDTFWDFISTAPESAHMIMWAMSDRALPRSYSMMEGFGVHTFRLVNNEGKSHFVKFHWKPLLGVHAVSWDEAQKISGRDPDFHRRDLWDSIESGAYPEWELGLQIIPEEDEHKFDFDLLDPTKLVPEELVPVEIVGKLTLNRNPQNYFSETEQVAFHVGHIVPGIDFTNDPLMQGRLFSYTDTQLIRLGGPNFQEIPINRPIIPVHNNQRDGFMRQAINVGKTAYSPNLIADNAPAQVKESDGGFTSYNERIDAKKVRGRSESFLDHYSQAQLFYNSQSTPEKNHIVNALTFELSKVKQIAIRERILMLLGNINEDLQRQVADNLGLEIPSSNTDLNLVVPADGDIKLHQSKQPTSSIERSEALSMEKTKKESIKSRQIAVLLADGFIAESLTSIQQKIEQENGLIQIIAPSLRAVKSNNGSTVQPDQAFLTADAVLFDAVCVLGGEDSFATLASIPDAVQFVNDTYKHCKAILLDKDGSQKFIQTTHLDSKNDDAFFISKIDKESINRFIKAIAAHRVWHLEDKRLVPA
ncbi:catalase [Sphingobacterium corticis]|uniref:Catalase n=1 Tax=Sphingobacterium corticis TaxID=1812823 RepID=A0ABW5NNR3_9SPHI